MLAVASGPLGPQMQTSMRLLPMSMRKALISWGSGSSWRSDNGNEAHDASIAHLTSVLNAKLRWYGLLSLLDVHQLAARAAVVLYTAAMVMYWRGYGVDWAWSGMSAVVIGAVAYAQLILAEQGYIVGADLRGMLLASAVRRERLRAQTEEVDQRGSTTSMSMVDAYYAELKRRSAVGVAAFSQKPAAVPDSAQDLPLGPVPPPSPAPGSDLETPVLSAYLESVHEESFGAKSINVHNKVLGILDNRRGEFWISLVVHFALLSLWHIRGAVVASDAGRQWEMILAIASLVLGCAASIPFTAQLCLGLSILEVTGTLVIADLEGFRDVILSSLYDRSLDVSECVAELDLTQMRLQRHTKRLNRIFVGALTGFVSSQLALVVIYIFCAFLVRGTGERDQFGTGAQAVLIAISALVASNMVAVLRLIARPADAWRRILSDDIAHFRVTAEAIRVFGDYASFYDALKEKRVGFMLGGVVITSTVVLNVTGSLVIAIAVAIFEKFG